MGHHIRALPYERKDENDTVVDVESVRRREQGSAPHQFAANGRQIGRDAA